VFEKFQKPWPKLGVDKRKGDPKVDHPLKKSWVEKLKMKTDGFTTYFYYRHCDPNSLIYKKYWMIQFQLSRSVERGIIEYNFPMGTLNDLAI